MAALLVRAMELPDAGECFFDDIAESPHRASINAIAAAEITAGCGDRRYCPDDQVAGRQLMASLQGGDAGIRPVLLTPRGPSQRLADVPVRSSSTIATIRAESSGPTISRRTVPSGPMK
jgi:hypothetical protein